MKNLYFYLVAFFGLWAFEACTSRNTEARYYMDVCESPDSIVSYYRKHKDELPVKYFYQITTRLVRDRKIKEVEDILNLRTGFVDELNELQKSYYYLDIAAFNVMRKVDLTRKYLGEIPQNILDQRDSVAVDYYQILGHYYYNKNLLDSAFDEFKKGYTIAMELGDTFSMGRIAVNLGGLQSLLGYDFAAMEYLMRAVTFDPKNLILANNLASVLIKQKQLDRAKEVLEEHKDVLQVAKPNTEELMFRLTYVHWYQEMGEWAKAYELLKTVALKNVPVNQVFNFHSFWLLHYAYTEPKRVVPYLDTILKQSGKEAYSELFYYLSNWSTRMNLDAIYDHYGTHLNQIDTVDFDPVTYAAYYQIVSQNARKQGNAVYAAQCETKSATYLRNYFQQKIESKELDLLNRLDLYKLERRYAEIRFEAESIKMASKRKNLILGFGTLMLGVIGYAWNKQRKLRLKNEALTHDLFEQKQKELEILEREKETSKKLVEMSSRILEASKKLKLKLSTLPEKNLPGIKESLEDLDYILFLNQSVDTTVIATGYDFEKLPFLQEMITSQRNVLSLSLDNYRPKEIGVTLNLSYSYVRNVQTRLRKTLKDNGFDTFEDLRKFLET